MTAEQEARWTLALAWLRRDDGGKVPDFTMHTWINPCTLRHMEDGRWVVEAPDHIRTWVRDRYLPLLVQAATAATGAPVTVELVGPDERVASIPRTPDGRARRKGTTLDGGDALAT